MRKFIFPALVFLFGIHVAIEAQTPATTPTIPASAAKTADSGIKPTLALGEVSAINQNADKVVLQTKDGVIDVVLSAATIYKRVSPENPKLSAATAATLSDIGIGDKILVTGAVAADKKSVPAKSVYLMTKADITKKNNSEREAWKLRGISGRVVSLNPNTQEFTIATRGMMGEQNVVISPKTGVNYRRYAPDSVKFDDAKTSSFSELKIGDQIRALGDKGADGTNFKAERVVSGSFKMVGGTITAIDAAKKEITIKDIQTGKPATIIVNDNSALRKFPAEFAQMMAMRMSGGGGFGGGTGQGGNVTARPPQQPGTQPGNSGSQPPPNPPNVMPQGDGMRAGGGRGEIDEMLERFPTISLTDLKIGDAIAVSSTTGAVPNRVTAIKLLSGVEPFLNAPQMAAGGRRNAGGGQGGFTIPGLDGGIGTP